MAKKQIWVVESADEDEGQIFEDWVPAETAGQAEAEVEKLRGDYAEICETTPLRKQIAFQRKKLKQMERALTKDGIAREQKEWDAFLKKEGDIVRLDDGSLGELDTEEVDQCQLCKKYYRPGDDSWDGLDPDCADKVSEYLDKHGLDNEDKDDAIEALQRKRKRE